MRGRPNARGQAAFADRLDDFGTILQNYVSWKCAERMSSQKLFQIMASAASDIDKEYC